MPLHPQTAAFLAAYNASAPVIDYDTVTAAELHPEIGGHLGGIARRRRPHRSRCGRPGRHSALQAAGRWAVSSDAVHPRRRDTTD